MNSSQVKSIVEKLAPTIDAITDENVKSVFGILLNVIECLVSEVETLRAENQILRDENNRLKGGPGKPDIRKQTKGPTDTSSEKDRARNTKSKKAKRNRNKKNNRIKIDRIEFCQLDQNTLPHDAVFKGYHNVIVQDIIIRTDNIKFRKAVFYSASLRKTFIATLPNGYQGEFGPNIKTSVITLNHKSKMTESAIVDFLKDHGVFIGAATVSGFLTKDHEDFHQEKHNIVLAGLQSTIYQQMDDTGARVNGRNYYNHILCNEFYTAYFTRPRKDRLTIVEILTQGELQFLFNQTAFALMRSMKLPMKVLQELQKLPLEKKRGLMQMETFLNTLFPVPKRHQTNRRIILDATAIAAYQELPHAVNVLLSDDAPQYNLIAKHHPLCWVHDGRHYKKLAPIVPQHSEQLNSFRTAYWDFYHKLLAYKTSPTASTALLLRQEFDILFSTQTGYEDLDARIKKTRAQKEQLLLVLRHPVIPLHNNDAELGARDQARRRDINLHTISKKGTEAKDTFMTLSQTAKKLSVNFYHYIRDRIEKKFDMPSLASLITRRSTELVPDTTT